MMLPRQTAAQLVDRQKASCDAKQYVNYSVCVYVLLVVIYFTYENLLEIILLIILDWYLDILHFVYTIAGFVCILEVKPKETCM